MTGVLPGTIGCGIAPGFRQSVVPSLMVDIAKSYI